MVAELTNHPDFKLPISGIRGIEMWQDAVEFFLMGATTVQVCTAVMHYGFRIVTDLSEGVSEYLNSHGMKKISDLTGITARKLRKWEELDLNYKIIARINSDTCIGCQLCYIACEDGAHQSNALVPGARIPKIKEDTCVGCNLCSLVCPVENCITMVPVGNGKPKLVWADHPKNPDRVTAPISS